MQRYELVSKQPRFFVFFSMDEVRTDVNSCLILVAISRVVSASLTFDEE